MPLDAALLRFSILRFAALLMFTRRRVSESGH